MICNTARALCYTSLRIDLKLPTAITEARNPFDPFRINTFVPIVSRVCWLTHERLTRYHDSSRTVTRLIKWLANGRPIRSLLSNVVSFVILVLVNPL